MYARLLFVVVGIFGCFGGFGPLLRSSRRLGTARGGQHERAHPAARAGRPVLFDSDDFPVPIPDPEAAAEIVVQRLIDAGFEIKAPELAQP